MRSTISCSSREGGAGEGWITCLFCGSVWTGWGSRRHFFSADPSGFMLGAEPLLGEHFGLQGRRALKPDRAPDGGEERLTAGGMTLPLSTDPLH